MANQTILIIDPDTKVLSVMEVQLRKYGYVVHSSSTEEEALQQIHLSPPDLIISEVSLGDRDGIALCRKLKSEASTSHIPWICLSSDISEKVRTLESGAEEFLIKPIYMADLKDRVESVLQQKQRLGLEQGNGNRFFGRLEEMGLLDLLQIIDVSKRSGRLNIEHKGRKGQLWFQDGELLDATMNHLEGANAIYRLLTWDFGQYEFDFTPPTRENRINESINTIKAEGMSRVAQWNSMCEQLPPLETIFRVEQSTLDERRGRGETLSIEIQQILDLFDGKRTMIEVIDTSTLPDLTSLQHLTQLYFEGLVYEVREALVDEDRPDPVFLESSTPDEPEPPNLPQENSFSTMATQAGEIFPEPPPIVVEGSGTPLPEEGQELLADLYASIAIGDEDPPPPPPPVPQASEDEGPSEDDFSTLFGTDGSYAFDDSEQDFFASLEGDEDEYRPAVVKEPMSGGMKSFLFLLLIAVVGATAMIMKDSVSPLKTSVLASNKMMWHRLELQQRSDAYDVGPLEADWKIEKVDQIESDLSDPDTSKSMKNELTPLKANMKGRKLNKREKKRIAGLLKEAKSMHDLGTPSSYGSAAKLVEEALALQPVNLYGLLLSAKIHLEIDEYRIALQRLEMIKDINPSYENRKLDPSFQKGTIFILIGSALQGLKQPQRALKYYEDYIRLFPKGNHVKEIHRVIPQLQKE
jgi:DNA-binding response OmpR family regulator